MAVGSSTPLAATPASCAQIQLVAVAGPRPIQSAAQVTAAIAIASSGSRSSLFGGYGGYGKVPLFDLSVHGSRQYMDQLTAAAAAVVAGNGTPAQVTPLGDWVQATGSEKGM